MARLLWFPSNCCTYLQHPIYRSSSSSILHLNLSFLSRRRPDLVETVHANSLVCFLVPNTEISLLDCNAVPRRRPSTSSLYPTRWRGRERVRDTVWTGLDQRGSREQRRWSPFVFLAPDHARLNFSVPSMDGNPETLALLDGIRYSSLGTLARYRSVHARSKRRSTFEACGI